jgi:hypothetical protein
MAREAGMRNRIAELDLAEKYYLAAVAALTPSAPHNIEDTPDDLSPLSSDGGHGSFSRRASDAVSIASEHSISTQATSVGGDDDDSGPIDGMGEGKGSDELISSLPSLTLHIGKTRSKPSPIAISTAVSHQHSQTTLPLCSLLRNYAALPPRQCPRPQGPLHNLDATTRFLPPPCLDHGITA